MKIISGFPPNIQEILNAGITVDDGSMFCWGSTLYVPSGKEVPEELLIHERVHKRQQVNPEVWWTRWLMDKEFRLNQELEAYSAQYQAVKERCPAKVTKEALEEMAENLSELYNLDISFHKAFTLIRKYGDSTTRKSS